MLIMYLFHCSKGNFIWGNRSKNWNDNEYDRIKEIYGKSYNGANGS